MTQAARERRRAQRRLARQIREGTYEPSAAGKKARQAARAVREQAARTAREQPPPATPREAAALLRLYQADDAWTAAEEKMAGSPFDLYGPPARSSDPSNPRIYMMEYWQAAQMVKVYWGDGGRPYVFFGISQPLWTQWKLSASPGRFLNRNLAGKPYMPSPF
jgi:hypothetical protein